MGGSRQRSARGLGCTVIGPPGHVPVAVQRRRHQLAERPWTPGEEVFGRLRLGHRRHVRQPVRAVCERHEMPVDGDALDGQPVRPLQYPGVGGIRVGRPGRLRARARLHVVAARAPVWRADRHAHAFSQRIRRLMGSHVDHVDLEVRILSIVVHHGNRNIGPVSPGTFEACEAHVIFHVVLARDEHRELAFRRHGRQHPHFGRSFGRGADHDAVLVETHADPDPEPLVVLMEDDFVLLDRRADAVPAHLARPPGIIKRHVEHPPRVRREACRADAVKALWQLIARVKITNAEVVPLVTSRIDAVQHPSAVLADGQAAQREEIMPLGLAVRIKHHLLARQRTGSDGAPALIAGSPDFRRRPIVLAAHRHPALHGVLAAFAGTREIPVSVHAHRHRHVGLLHMRLQLVEQRAAQPRQPRHAGVAVRVLRGHIVAHLG